MPKLIHGEQGTGCTAKQREDEQCFFFRAPNTLLSVIFIGNKRQKSDNRYNENIQSQQQKWPGNDLQKRIHSKNDIPKTSALRLRPIVQYWSLKSTLGCSLTAEVRQLKSRSYLTEITRLVYHTPRYTTRVSYNGYYPSFPNWWHGFDSRHPLHEKRLRRLVARQNVLNAKSFYKLSIYIKNRNPRFVSHAMPQAFCVATNVRFC